MTKKVLKNNLKNKNGEFIKNGQFNTSKNFSNNPWKFIAIIFIILFVLVIVGGLLRVYAFKSSFRTASDSQIAYAKSIALADIASKENTYSNTYSNNVSSNYNSSNYQIRSSNIIRNIKIGSMNTDTLEVSVYNQSVRNLYIIDIQSGNILVYTKTIFYDGFNHVGDIDREMPKPFQR